MAAPLSFSCSSLLCSASPQACELSSMRATRSSRRAAAAAADSDTPSNTNGHHTQAFPASPKSALEVEYPASEAALITRAQPARRPRVSAGFSLRICTANVCVFPAAGRNRTVVGQYLLACATAIATLFWAASQSACNAAHISELRIRLAHCLLCMGWSLRNVLSMAVAVARCPTLHLVVLPLSHHPDACTRVSSLVAQLWSLHRS
jgi:hypothetical protein